MGRSVAYSLSRRFLVEARRKQGDGKELKELGALDGRARHS